MLEKVKKKPTYINATMCQQPNDNKFWRHLLEKDFSEESYFPLVRYGYRGVTSSSYVA